MSESFVTAIAGGNTVQNKIAVVLNQAGDSPNNPILQGLGFNIDLRLSPNVLWFQAYQGISTPAEDILVGFIQVDEQQWRLSGAAGLGSLALPFDYSRPSRHFFRIEVASSSYVVGIERECWIKADPPIELYYCGAALQWCCDAANSYIGPDAESGGARLVTDPGEPPFVPTPPVTVPAFGVVVNVEDAEIITTPGGDPIATRDVSFFATFSPDVLGMDVTGIEVTGNGTYLGDPVVYDLVGTFVGIGGGTYNATTGEFFGSGTFTATGKATNVDLGINENVEITATTGSYLSNAAVYDGNRYCDDLQPANDSAVIEVGPSKITTIYAQDFVASATAPLELPLRIMHTWRDEFNQKHYGGAKYVSVFEEGFAEDAQGPFIENIYNGEVQNVNSLSVIDIDPDHEYRIIFRFRSELDDDNYVDKLIRLRIVTQEQLRVQFQDDIDVDDMPNIVYDEDSNTFSWMFDSGNDFTTLAISKASVIVDNEVVDLPLDETSSFPGDWSDIRAITHGGEVVVRFTRQFNAVAYEQLTVLYRISRPNGASALPIEIDKVFNRRDVASKSQSFLPETAFRLIMPSLAPVYGGAVGKVFLETINNVVDYKQVIVATEKGSIKLETPLRNGLRYDVDALFEVDPATGAVQNHRALVILQTENSTRVYEIYPQTFKPRITLRAPVVSEDPTDPASDFVIPEVFSRTWPDINITWPLTTDQGEDYELVPMDGDSGEQFRLWSDKGIAVGYIFTKGIPGPYNLDGIAFYNSPTVTLQYRAIHPVTGSVYDYLVELPIEDNHSEIPDTGVVGNDDIGAIYYNNYFILTRRPKNLISVELKNKSDPPRTLYSEELRIGQWIDIGRVSDDLASLTMTTTVYDETTMLPVETENPLLRVVPLRQILVSEVANNDVVWDTGRLLDTDKQMPRARINYIDKTIEFAYDDRYTSWYRWSAMNPLDRTVLTFSERPPQLTIRDISRLFRDDRPFRLEVGQSIVVTFVHQDGPHVTALYKISGDFVEPVQTNILRGRTWQQKSTEIE